MSEKTVELQASSFDKSVAQGIVFVDYWAPWCGPCRMFGPIFEKAAAAHPDITFGKVNTEEQPELAARFDVSAIPTLMIFRDGILLFSRAGLVPQAALEDLITQVRGLDMDDVRRQIAAQQKSTPASASAAAR